jgi:alpha-beta hydrolase superfamily lysophospholipase
MRPTVRHIAGIAALALSSLALGACAPGVQPLPLSERVATEIGTDTFRGPDGTLFPMRRWLPDGKPRAVIVGLHGFGDYSVAFRTPAAYWASQGIATYAYDQRGFGGTPHVFHWAGTDTMADDAKAVVAALRKRYPSTPIYLLGESMGGAVAIVAGSGQHPANVDGLILVSPAIWEHNFMGSLERSALWLAGLAAPGWWLEPPRGLGIHPSDNIDMLRAMARDSLIQGGARVDTTAGLMDLMDRALDDEPHVKLPMLALFGAHEEVLPHAAVSSFLAHLPTGNAHVAIYPHGYHMLLRDLHGEVVAKDIVSWIENRSAKLPSGHECPAAAADPSSCKTLTS